MIYRIYKPELFQGSLKKKKYFEGWYFKHVNKERSHIISVIPGISITRNESHSFVQILDSDTGQGSYVSYSLNEFRWNRRRFLIEIGPNVFTSDFIDLNIEGNNTSLKGHLSYQNSVGYPGKLLSPGIMGWYSFVPFMECNHGIVSVIHEITGKLEFQGKEVDFTQGKGYIEKDWGTSFPEAWIWMQSSNFKEPYTSFSFSIAKIPWLGSYFIGFISFFFFSDKFYLFSTYNGSVVTEVTHDDRNIHFIVRNKKCRLHINVMSNSFSELIAPVSGEMSRTIKESPDSEIYLELYDNTDKLTYSGKGHCAGLEIIEKIFDYI
jgi:tocopherol cyclase